MNAIVRIFPLDRKIHVQFVLTSSTLFQIPPSISIYQAILSVGTKAQANSDRIDGAQFLWAHAEYSHYTVEFPFFKPSNFLWNFPNSGQFFCSLRTDIWEKFTPNFSNPPILRTQCYFPSWCKNRGFTVLSANHFCRISRGLKIEVAVIGADHKDCGLWRREWTPSWSGVTAQW